MEAKFKIGDKVTFWHDQKKKFIFIVYSIHIYKHGAFYDIQNIDDKDNIGYKFPENQLKKIEESEEK